MAKQKSHIKHTVAGVKVAKESVSGSSENVEIIIPQGMPYVKVRKALELALLRIR